eukprot:Cvel_22039.t1-p1 / transcript=Cvel_22039.t1 / gene=Cvel_22039 / organism=Chromera_velia_CCMP2878 / gene_product=hypothetical protein / transcript_product=hypothetical protein / location=Cvel_scaffold2127:28792-32968(+) / protein_length=1005 / sequence_SO=supercontig / SO=protein_coding / is_pseudo=false
MARKSTAAPPCSLQVLWSSMKNPFARYQPPLYPTSIPFSSQMTLTAPPYRSQLSTLTLSFASQKTGTLLPFCYGTDAGEGWDGFGEMRLIARFPPSVLRLLDVAPLGGRVETNFVKFAGTRVCVELRRGRKRGRGDSDTLSARLRTDNPSGAFSTLNALIVQCDSEFPFDRRDTAQLEAQEFTPNLGRCSATVVLGKSCYQSEQTREVAWGYHVPGGRTRRLRWASLHSKRGITLEILLQEAEPAVLSLSSQHQVFDCHTASPPSAEGNEGILWGPLSLHFPDSLSALTKKWSCHRNGKGKFSSRYWVKGTVDTPVRVCVPVGGEKGEVTLSFSLSTSECDAEDCLALQVRRESGDFEGEIDVEFRGEVKNTMRHFVSSPASDPPGMITFSFLHCPMRSVFRPNVGRPVGRLPIVCEKAKDLYGLMDVFGIVRLDDVVLRLRPLNRLPAPLAPQWPSQWAVPSGCPSTSQTHSFPLAPLASLVSPSRTRSAVEEAFCIAEEIKHKGYVLEVIFGVVRFGKVSDQGEVVRFWLRISPDDSQIPRVLPPLTVRCGLEGPPSSLKEGWMVGRQVPLLGGLFQAEVGRVGVELFDLYLSGRGGRIGRESKSFEVPGNPISAQRLWVELSEPLSFSLVSQSSKVERGGQRVEASFEMVEWKEEVERRSCPWKSCLLVFEEMEFMETFRLRLCLRVPERADEGSKAILQLAHSPPDFRKGLALKVRLELQAGSVNVTLRDDHVQIPGYSETNPRVCETELCLSEIEQRDLHGLFQQSANRQSDCTPRAQLSILRAWGAELISEKEMENWETEYVVVVPDFPSFLQSGACTVETSDKDLDDTLLRFSLSFPPAPDVSNVRATGGLAESESGDEDMEQEGLQGAKSGEEGGGKQDQIDRTSREMRVAAAPPSFPGSNDVPKCTFSISWPKDILTRCGSIPPGFSNVNWWDALWGPLRLHVFDETGGDSVLIEGSDSFSPGEGLRFVTSWEGVGEEVERLVQAAQKNERQEAIF